MIAYAFSLITTYMIMVLFKHAQPALVFIVPYCTAAILMIHIKKKNAIPLWKYSTTMLISRRT